MSTLFAGLALTSGVLGFSLPVRTGVLGFSPTIGRRHGQLQAAAENDLVTALDERTWEELLQGGAAPLKVVKFFAPWCRSCKAVEPQYKRAAEQLTSDEVAFFEVDFSQNKKFCLRERVFQLPTVHFYVRGVGRVHRFTPKGASAAARIKREVLSFVQEGEARPSRVALMEALHAEVVRPVIAYAELVAVAEALAASLGDSKQRADPSPLLVEALEEDEARLARLEALFFALDTDGSGALSEQELCAAMGVTGGAEGATRRADAVGELISRRGAGGEPLSIDLPAFVAMMRRQEVASLSRRPEEELMPAFEALDLDGDGLISKQEMLTILDRLSKGMPSLVGSEGGGSAVPDAFEAFDLDDSGSLSYAEFVAMVS